MTKKNSGAILSGVHFYSIPAIAIRFRESARHTLRQILLYIFACTCLLMVFNGWLDPAYLATHPFLNIFVTALLIATPLGIILYFLLALFRFAFRR